MKNIEWFKSEFEPHLKNYEVKYKFFEDGDLGNLDQVEFNTAERGGEIDFWSSGWLNVHFVNYVSGNELINILLAPEQYEHKNRVLDELKSLL